MSQEEQRLYEGMYILRASLSNEAREKAVKKIEDDIQEFGGEIVKKHERGRQRLAYDIAGQRDGYFYLLYFKVLPSALKPMHQAYHLMEDLLRCMTLQAEEVMESLEFKPIGEQQ